MPRDLPAIRNMSARAWKKVRDQPWAGAAKSQIAQQVAAATNRQYVDVRALLLDPVDLRGIPWRDTDDRTRWAPPAFLLPSDDPGRWLINLEELPSAVPLVQAALYQLVLDRKVGEYELPEGASLIACGNRETDRGVVHRMPTPLASRFVHLDIRVDAEDWLDWGAGNGIVPEVLFFVLWEASHKMKDRISGVEPDSLRPSRTFDPVVRDRVKRDADVLMEQFAGYFPAQRVEPAREVA